MSRKTSSVQARYVAAREVREEVLCLSTHASQTNRREYCAALEVRGRTFHLASDEEQRSILERFQRFLAGLTHPLQILIRVRPVAIEPFLGKIALPAQDHAHAVAPLAMSMAQFLRDLALERALLERTWYVIIPAPTVAQTPSASLWPTRAVSSQRQHEEAFVAAHQHLELRCREIATQFAAMGLSTHRLDAAALINLNYQCLRPQQMAHHPFHPQVVDGPQPLARSLHSPQDMHEEVRTGTKHTAIMPLADLLAPARVEVQHDHLLIDGQYAATFVVTQLPRLITAGWLRPLIELDQPIEISLHVQPRATEAVLRHLRRRQLEIESSFLLAQEKQRLLDPSMQVAQGDIQGLLAQLASGEERLLDWSMVVLVQGETPQRLRQQAARVRSVLSSMLVAVRPAAFEQEQGFLSCQPHARNPLGAPLLLPSAAVATAFPFLSASLRMEHGILEGITPAGEPVMLDWWASTQRNANRLLVAPSGSGKSFKAKLDLLRTHLLWTTDALRQREGHVTPPVPSPLSHQQIVIDPEREYQRIADALGGQWIRLAPGSWHHLNPFDVPRPRPGGGCEPHEGDVLADHVQHLLALFDILLADRRADAAGTLSGQEKGLLDAVIYETYLRAGISRNPATHARPAPLLEDLARVLASGVCGADETGLAQRLHPFVSGSLAGLFAGPTNVALDNPLVVFDVYDLSSDLRPLGFFLISTFVWAVSFGSSIPRQLIVDELLSLYQYREGARFLETLFQRARKHFLGITGITQHPALLAQSTIPSNCATHLLLAQEAASLDVLAAIFKLSAQEQQLLRMFGKGDGLLLSHEQRLALHFAASAYEHTLATTDRQELRVLEQQAISREDLTKQSTGPLHALPTSQVVHRAGTLSRKGWWSYDAPR